MDPTWTVCAFCKAEGIGSESASGRKKTIDENSAPQGNRGTKIDPDLPDLHSQSSASSNRASGQSNAPHGSQKSEVKKTVFGAPVAGVASADGGKPKIVGVLATFTWKADGQVFMLREGRNKIGRSPDCDIVIEQDNSLSAWNTSIAYRSGTFVIIAKDAMNGTFVDSVEVMPESSAPLPNYSTIRAGSTTFKFVALDPGPTPAAV
jgi:hypothetical protein